MELEKFVKIFGEPFPYDLIDVEYIYDPKKVIEEPKSFTHVKNIDEEITKVKQLLIDTYKTDLISYRITGSYANNTAKSTSDLDLLAILEKTSNLNKFDYNGPAHITLISIKDLEKYLMLGDILIGNYFLKSRPLYETRNIDYLFDVKPVPTKAIPYLKTKCLFQFKTAEILSLLGKKFMKTAQYIRHEVPILFDDKEKSYHVRFATEIDREASIYFYKTLDRLHFSTTFGVATYIIPEGKIPGLDIILEFSDSLFKDEPNIVRDLYVAKKAWKHKEKILGDREISSFMARTKRFIEKYVEAKI